MILERWDYKARAYKPYEIPDTWKVGVYRENLSDDVDCAICGDTITYGESYTSPTIHTEILGIGYCVCGKCHMEEMKHRLSFGPANAEADNDGN